MILIKCLVVMAIMLNLCCNAPMAVSPEDCVICGRWPLNGPCIVNTLNGDVWEVQVFPPHPNISNAIQEIEEGKDYGICWLLSGLNYKGTGIALPDDGEAWLSIKVDIITAYTPALASRYFCQNCLDKLNDLQLPNNLVVADIYGLAEGWVEYYALTLESSFDVRHYTFRVAEALEGRVDIILSSSYYEGGKLLDY